MDEILHGLKALFEGVFNDSVVSVERLPRSASYRQYYRIRGRRNQVIGTYNPNESENIAFIYMSEYFRSHGLNVPLIYGKNIKKYIYLQEDLGNQTLKNHIRLHPHTKLELLRKVLDYLVKFQTIDLSGFDWSKCYPAPAFDRTAYMFDLNYFKFMVLRLLKVHYNDLALEEQFQHLLDRLLETEHKYFVYRDFQSRNIMLFKNDLYFIDYQGGRRGSLFYDLVSLLYDTKLELTHEERMGLAKHYFNRTKHLHNLSFASFWDYVLLFALVRKMQALAAYCFRGIVENKVIFLSGLQKAFGQVMDIVKNNLFQQEFTLLVDYISEAYRNLPYRRQKVEVSIEINSFSYLHGGYPPDEYDNGGGFVFDCRMLPNPGRLEQFAHRTGLDSEVASWLEVQPEFEEFIVSAFRMIYQAVITYQAKGYTHLQVNFGCTGGQHRSVYCAKKIAWLLGQFFDTEIVVYHRQKQSWPGENA